MLRPVPEDITTVSPPYSRVMDPVPVKEEVISRNVFAGRATTPGSFIVPATFLSIPVSRLVALSFIPSSPATITIPANTGNVVDLLSANRETLATASENSFFSIVMIIRLILLGLGIGG